MQNLLRETQQSNKKPKYGKLVPLYPVEATIPNRKGVVLRSGPGGYPLVVATYF